MPTLTRANTSMTRKRNCIEVETPLIPKKNGGLQNKKRKLEKEFSPQCDINHQAQSGNKISPNKRSTRNLTKGTPLVNKIEKKVTNVKKGSPKNKKDVLPKKTYQKKRKKVATSKVNQEPSGDLHVPREVDKSKNLKSNTNQKRVNEAIEKITNRRSKEDNIHECFLSVLSKDNEETKEKDGCEIIEVNGEKKTDIGEETDDEENYQRKYFQLLNMMKSLQDEFLASQQNFEQHVAANDDFLENMKGVLNDKNNELVCTRQELKLCQTHILELENCKRQHELELKSLNTKVQGTNVIANNSDNTRENILMKEIDDQKMKLDCYRTLTGLSLEKDQSLAAQNDDDLSMCQSFVCSFKSTKNSKDMKFSIRQDREFAEIEYRPLFCSPEGEQQYSGLPAYLQGQIFFADEQAPKFLLRLLQNAHEPKKK